MKSFCRLPLLGILLGICIPPVFFVSCSKQEAEPEEVIRPVRYQQVFLSGGSRSRSFSGVAKSGTESHLSFKVPGTITSLAVKLGDVVRDGQLIARLDPNDYNLQVQQAQATLTAAEAQARNARADLNRIRALYENDNASKNEYDQVRAASESADANVLAANKGLEQARLQLSYTRLKAPLSGSIAAVPVEANENVQAGQTIALLNSGSQLEVQVAVPEVLIADISEGSEVGIQFDALPGKVLSGIVREVGVASLGSSTTFPVIVRVTESHDDILPGMAAEVTFSFERRSGSGLIIVPPVAVAEDRQGRYVYVAEPGDADIGIVKRRDVSVGELTSDGMEIISGLDDGDLVITAGVTRIHPDMQVKLLGAKGE